MENKIIKVDRSKVWIILGGFLFFFESTIFGLSSQLKGMGTMNPLSDPLIIAVFQLLVLVFIFIPLGDIPTKVEYNEREVIIYRWLGKLKFQVSDKISIKDAGYGMIKVSKGFGGLTGFSLPKWSSTTREILGVIKQLNPSGINLEKISLNYFE